MYSVVLVDDEDIIVEGLKKIVKWDEFGCEVIGTADDAASGSALIRAVHPDILFTDIRMPGLDGLAMIAGLRSEFPDMQIIVLTGYRDFSYAQEAIRLGVLRFLLKPSRMSEIGEAVSAAVEKLRHISTGKEDSDAHQSGNFIVSQAERFIEEHYPDKLTLQSVADCCYVSQWHLSKLLNSCLGMSFYDLLNDVRIRKAKELLKNSSLKIGEISELVGYADPGHFARTFKKITGMSANEFRNGL